MNKSSENSLNGIEKKEQESTGLADIKNENKESDKEVIYCYDYY